MDFPLLIFTDLDGTLLDHHSYSFKGAEKALQVLRQHSIPLIFTSSKTKAEIQLLQEKMGLHEPFIAENGGGIYLPADYAELDTKNLELLEGYRGVLFGKSYEYLRNVFEKFRDKYKIKGFGDMTAAEIMNITGLTLENAILAGKRNFTEPFLFLAESRPLELQKELLGYGLRLTRGGRFYHLMSAQQDKGRAVKKTVHLFQGQSLEKITAVGLGDAENDYSMLEAVDVPVLLPKPDGHYEKMDLPGLIRAPSQGSKGWGAVMKAILSEFTQ